MRLPRLNTLLDDRTVCAVGISPLWAPPPLFSTWRAALPCWPWRTCSVCSACPCVRACAPVRPHRSGPPPTLLCRRPCLPPLGVDGWADHAWTHARTMAPRGRLVAAALSCTGRECRGRVPLWSRAPPVLRGARSLGLRSRRCPCVLLSPNVCGMPGRIDRGALRAYNRATRRRRTTPWRRGQPETDALRWETYRAWWRCPPRHWPWSR